MYPSTAVRDSNLLVDILPRLLLRLLAQLQPMISSFSSFFPGNKVPGVEAGTGIEGDSKLGVEAKGLLEVEFDVDGEDD